MDAWRGFTLIELLVVLVVLSILSTITYPAMMSWAKRAEHRMEVYNLVGWLHEAKIEAIKTNSFVVIEAKPNGYSIFMDDSEAPGEAGDWLRQPGERQLVECRFKDGLTLASNFPNDKARFSSRPGITAGRFIIDMHGSKMDVIINAVGRIRVE